MLSIKNGNNSLINSKSNLSIVEQENLNTEKKNLINIFKLVIKDLIDSSSIKLNKNKNIETSTSFELFFDVFENILNHGFKGKKGLYYLSFQKKDYSSLLDIVESKFDNSNKNLKSIKDISEIKTSLGRVRAWLRILLMQKQLSETFSLLIQEKDLLNEIYEKDSILVSDEANIIVGLLIGLNALDFSIDLKAILEILDLPLHLINYSNYLRERIPSEFDETSNLNDNENKICEIFNQKNFVEELNKKQEAQLEYLTRRVTDLEKSNFELNDQSTAFKLENKDLLNKLNTMELEKVKLEEEYKTKYDALINDHSIERETYLNSKSGLDSMYIELQKKILEETKLRTSLENEVTIQQTMKNELETALKLMDHSLIDKQETINRLRDQLDQVKSLNLELNQKNITLTQEYNQNKEKLNRIEKENEELKVNLNDKHNMLLETIESFNKQEIDLCKCKQKNENLETNFAIEKNWRIELQNELSIKNDLIRISNEKLKHLDDTNNQLDQMRFECLNLKETNSELEKTLEEMGSKLGDL